VLPAWEDFPTDDVVADTALMNRRLQGYIDAMPEQYYWVHKRFKTRPQGQPSVY
jgi:KDO2-lipid IV(A) lauroyltransferase